MNGITIGKIIDMLHDQFGNDFGDKVYQIIGDDHSNETVLGAIQQTLADIAKENEPEMASKIDAFCDALLSGDEDRIEQAASDLGLDVPQTDNPQVDSQQANTAYANSNETDKGTDSSNEAKSEKESEVKRAQATPEQVERYEKAKAEYEDLKDKYTFKNTFVIAAKIEYMQAAYDIGAKVDGKPVSGGNIAVSYMQLFNSSLFESLIEQAIYNYFADKFPPKEPMDTGTTKEDASKPVDNSTSQPVDKETKPEDSKYTTDASGRVRDDGYMSKPLEKDEKWKDLGMHGDNPLRGNYMGVDMTKPGYELKSMPGVEVKYAGPYNTKIDKPQMIARTYVDNGEMKTVRFSGMRYVQAFGNEYLVDPMGKVQWSDTSKNPDAVVKSFEAQLGPRKEITSQIESIAKNTHTDVETVKQGITNEALNKYSDFVMGKVEAHAAYIEKTAIPETQSQLDQFKDDIGKLDEKLQAIDDKLKDIDAKADAGKYTDLDKTNEDKLKEAKTTIETTKEKLETAATKAENRLEQLEQTLEKYKVGLDAYKEQGLDAKEKFAISTETIRDGAGRTDNIDFGIGKEEKAVIQEIEKPDYLTQVTGEDNKETETDRSEKDTETSQNEDPIESSLTDLNNKEDNEDPSKNVDADGFKEDNPQDLENDNDKIEDEEKLKEDLKATVIEAESQEAKAAANEEQEKAVEKPEDNQDNQESKSTNEEDKTEKDKATSEKDEKDAKTDTDKEKEAQITNDEKEEAKVVQDGNEGQQVAAEQNETPDQIEQIPNEEPNATPEVQVEVPEEAPEEIGTEEVAENLLEDGVPEVATIESETPEQTAKENEDEEVLEAASKTQSHDLPEPDIDKPTYTDDFNPSLEEPTSVNDDAELMDKITDAMKEFVEQGNEGTFSFMDDFLKDNPAISDDQLHEGAAKTIVDKAQDSHDNDHETNESFIDKVSDLMQDIASYIGERIENTFDKVENMFSNLCNGDIEAVANDILSMVADKVESAIDFPLKIADLVYEHYDPEGFAENGGIKEQVHDALDALRDGADIEDVINQIGDIFNDFISAIQTEPQPQPDVTGEDTSANVGAEQSNSYDPAANGNVESPDLNTNIQSEFDSVDVDSVDVPESSLTQEQIISNDGEAISPQESSTSGQDYHEPDSPETMIESGDVEATADSAEDSAEEIIEAIAELLL